MRIVGAMTSSHSSFPHRCRPVARPFASVILAAGLLAALSPATASAQPEELFAFRTSESNRGDLGGLAGADAICQRLADAARLPGTYRAWLSDSSTSAASRFADTSPGLPYIRPDGVVVAEDYADLTDGDILAPITVDENGVPAGPGAFQPWTATNTDGSIDESALTCNDWTSAEATDQGHGGRWIDTNRRWTDAGLRRCNGQRVDSDRFDATPLICLQFFADRDGDGIQNPFDVCPDDATNLCDPSFATLILVDEEVGGSCDAFGGSGQRIRAGLDDGEPGGVADDGVLADEEVDLTTFICNGATGPVGPNGEPGDPGAPGANGQPGADGLSTLIQVSAEPPGDNCPAGGQRIDAWLDLDRDGELDAELESPSTTFVCSAPAGVSPTITFTDEPAGANCLAGGQRLDVGIDADGNGVVEGDEIEDSSFLCDGSGGCSVSPTGAGEPAGWLLLVGVAFGLLALRRRR